MEVQLLELTLLGDQRGSLVAIESDNSIPFGIKRTYYIFGTQPNVARGFHAHKELRQFAVCVSGHCKMLLDDGISKEVVTLDSPTSGILIEPYIWHEMYEFSDNCVLLVLADDHYDESDYIRDYAEFEKMVKKNVKK